MWRFSVGRKEQKEENRKTLRFDYRQKSSESSKRARLRFFVTELGRSFFAFRRAKKNEK